MKIGKLGLLSLLGKLPEPTSVVSPLADVPSININRSGIQSLTKRFSKAQSKYYAPPMAKGKVESAKITPTPTPKYLIPKVKSEPYRHKFEYSKYANIPEGVNIPQPPPDKGQLMMEEFDPKGEATRAAVVAASEYLSKPFNDFQPQEWQKNNDGTFDRGYFHSNTKTFNDLLKKFPKQMAAIGATKHEDVYKPRIATKIAGLTKEYEAKAGAKPWSWWYGWKDKGITWK